MEIEEAKQGSLVILSPVGRVDGVGAPDLEKRFAGIAERGDFNVLMDCARMEYISSAGLRTVLIGARNCQKNKGKLTLCALQPECRSVMEISGFLNILDVYETRDEAIAARSGTDAA